MRLMSLVVLGLVACASGAPGPSDAEVQAQLEGELQAVVTAVRAGDAGGAVARFAPDARLVLTGIRDPNGQPLDGEIVGTDRIRGFLASVGAPPDFVMNAGSFVRAGDTVTQSGTWSVDDGAQSGSFTLEWRRTEEGTWRILAWNMRGG